ncbi:hypothetical protein MOQ72_13090 [Saccharopolyspora sp. K220]|uniref:DUF6777 domain-containing protein n=1 Tax=Saccharopolyspora soli TaxID=2926618 RepID=UPI001F5A7401|nr:DUF6777 domain-containing protein [Saccharopolyspora soli]MCI2418367.1 hypothetical protein [Saccharopolyspora soli]
MANNAAQRGKSTRVKVTTAGMAGALALGLVGGIACSQQSQSHEVQLEAVSTAGANPFSAPVGQDRTGVTPPAGSAGEYSGDTSGLFADNGDTPACDAQSLVSNLQADDAKAQAWAEVEGIKAADIPAFVKSLTPVVLRSDTSVTSHGYDAGKFVPYPAVLQAGTAVFIDGHGQPTVKCFNGNPLTKSDANQQGGYAGAGWAGFQPGSVTMIQPSSHVINEHSLVDVDTGGPVNRPGGPNPGKADPFLDALAKEAQERAAKSRLDADKALQDAKDAAKAAERSQEVANKKLRERDDALEVFQNFLKLFGPNDPRTIQAKQDFDTRFNQHKFAQAKADNDKNVATFADENAKKKDEDAKKAEQEAKQRQQDADDARNGKPVKKPTEPTTKPQPAPKPLDDQQQGKQQLDEQQDEQAVEPDQQLVDQDQQQPEQEQADTGQGGDEQAPDQPQPNNSEQSSSGS